MRNFLAIILTVFLSGTAHAKVTRKVQFEGRLITYGQLMRLTPDKRITYLREVGELLAQMEKSQKVYEVANNDVQELKEQVAFLMRMMSVFPQAEAQAGIMGSPSGRAVQDDCGDTLVWSRYTRSCVTGEMLAAQKAEEIAREARQAADAAASKQLLLIGSGNIGPDGMPIGTPKQGLAGGPSGTEATMDCGKTLKWSRYSHNCVNDQILSAQKEESEAREARRIADVNAVKDPVYVGSGMIGPDGRPLGEGKQALAGTPGGPAVQRHPKCYADLNWSKFSESCVNDQILAAQKADEEARVARLKADKTLSREAAVIGSGNIGPDGRPIGESKQGLEGGPSGPTSKEAAEKIAVAQKAEEAAREKRKEADAKPPEKPEPPKEQTGGEPPAKVTTGGLCEKPVFACSDLDSKARDQAIAEFRSDRSTQDCIAGGYFSTYQSPLKKVGTCNVTKEFKFLSGKDKNGEPVYKAKTCAAGKSGKPPEGMCNPAVFCLGLKVDDKLRDLVKNDKEVSAALPLAALDKASATVLDSKEKVLPIFLCAPVGQHMTEQCDKLVNDHVAGNLSRFGGKGKGEHYMACDAAKLKDFPLQNEWAELRAGVEAKYKAQCNNKQAKFTALFCTECKIIADRIWAMNEKATGEPCTFTGSPDAPSDDGSAKGIREKGS